MPDNGREDCTVTLSYEDMRRVHELVIARAVALEAAEEIAMQAFGAKDWRRPADTIRGALDNAR